MAIMTLLLSEYANEEIDVLRVLSMLLIHDLVEIDAGDTYAYDAVGGSYPAYKEKKLLHSAFTAFFQKTRENGFMIFGKSSKLMKHQRPNMRTCWTTVSRFF